jgi:hypothetical protein
VIAADTTERRDHDIAEMQIGIDAGIAEDAASGIGKQP